MTGSNIALLSIFIVIGLLGIFVYTHTESYLENKDKHKK